MVPDSDRGHTWQRGLQRWAPSGLTAGVAVMLLATGWLDVTTAVVSGLLLLLAWLFSPFFFPRSPRDAVAWQQAVDSDVPLIYWRPGCSYCVRLRLALGRTGSRAIWVDVSRDDDASARVRRVNGGDETVPTVFVGQSARVNPAPSWVRGQLRS